MTAADFATRDAALWLTQADRAADADFRRTVNARAYLLACHELAAHLYRTERVRVHLALEDGPTFGTGPPPDLDVARELVKVTTGAMSWPAELIECDECGAHVPRPELEPCVDGPVGYPPPLHCLDCLADCSACRDAIVCQAADEVYGRERGAP